MSGRHLTLLVIDDQNTDWSKYFRGKRIGDYDIRVEQAEFREITVTSTSDGASVSMAVFRGGTRVGRSFRPDFLLVRIRPRFYFYAKNFKKLRIFFSLLTMSVFHVSQDFFFRFFSNKKTTKN